MILRQIGREWSQLMVGRVNDTRNALQNTREEFATALDQFREIGDIPSDEVFRTYKQFNGKFERCMGRALSLSNHIRDLEYASEELFKEWDQELTDILDPGLAQRSSEMRETARQSYQEMMATIRASEAKTYEVLEAFEDRVLFLKHSSTAVAIANLNPTAIQADMAQLIQEMNASIAEADAFLEVMTSVES